MVPKHQLLDTITRQRFRAVLFRMVPKLPPDGLSSDKCFRAVLFRMVPKLTLIRLCFGYRFRAVLFRMVPKRKYFKRDYS